jgi:hypothetical protein
MLLKDSFSSTYTDPDIQSLCLDNVGDTKIKKQTDKTRIFRPLPGTSGNHGKICGYGLTKAPSSDKADTNQPGHDYLSPYEQGAQIPLRTSKRKTFPDISHRTESCVFVKQSPFHHRNQDHSLFPTSQAQEKKRPLIPDFGKRVTCIEKRTNE